MKFATRNDELKEGFGFWVLGVGYFLPAPRTQHPTPLLSSSFRVHRFFERVDLGEVALLVRADEEEPLVEIDGAPDGVREAYLCAVRALDAGAQCVERGARFAQVSERVGERRSRRACAVGRVEFLRARLLDEVGDGDGGEWPAAVAPRLKGCVAIAPRLFGLTQQRADEARDATLDHREMFDYLCD